MSETQSFSITIEQEQDYVFRVRFEGTGIPDLMTDEPEPLGGGSGPNPSRMLVAAVANCMGASLLFALRKYKNDPGPLKVKAIATMGRNEAGRMRVAKVDAQIELPEMAGSYQQLERILQQFEQFCVVTESVRSGVEVDVSVVDVTGALLHGPGLPAAES
ncbi:OsmC family protein [uncultured Aquimonas sp.]|jgi:organic hydroperoxide reductase OsmC/OhrA|uniref:OsmC family protein n=1 Tax=uncultured Aquimonas sp. TaxID=385483 RepID=UPI00086B5D19|nr:OsmC family protein [uncultured Aquimonas sp.]ODU44788.1 MAG: peroxiredoxin [Xanthomonadaceae bacterium SCN 69-123]